MKTNEFIKLNRRAILTGLIGMSIVGISFILLLFLIALLTNGQLPDLQLTITIILTTGIGFPIFGTIIGFLKWWTDTRSAKKSFNCHPFCELEKINFEKIRLNQNSKSQFIKEIYRGELNGFIVDIEPGFGEQAKYLQFRFWLKTTDIHGKLNSENFKNPETNSRFYSAITSYHREKHNLKSIEQLKTELIEITDTLNKEVH